MNVASLAPGFAALLPCALLAEGIYSGEGTAQVQMDLATQYVQWDWHPAGEGRIAVEATVDPSALTLTYDAMTITVTNLTIGFTNDFTAGFGQVSRMETILVFDPILCHATNLGTWRLTPGMDGVYQIAMNLGLPNQLFPDLTLSGQYRIRGPTETVSGTFALPFAQSDSNARFPNYDLDTAGYPQQLVLVPDDYYNVLSFGNGRYGTDFSGTVDGIRIDMDLRLIRFASRSVTLFPKPPQLGLVQLDSEGRAVLTACGSPGQSLVLQASADQRQWMPISTNLCGGEPLQLVDAESKSLSHRFYRLLAR